MTCARHGARRRSPGRRCIDLAIRRLRIRWRIESAQCASSELAGLRVRSFRHERETVRHFPIILNDRIRIVHRSKFKADCGDRESDCG